ncbi:MazG nucleotide pyrophosphohydrolase domain-containing protein [Natronobiforma cellulositropha]|uniref:MazG nucleotide pyrophosphohydrolase domain-containing protein n=1 Tax=Natronobiforma cellulositropha TaxID=1679076 RepID=UPI0021D5F9D9|nr:MazG nucleotide pyrophosphohydrolase domain-containing protein [Natronobiforma cellulositropha]
MDEQDAVADFFAEYDLESEPAYRVLDLASEVGELAKEVTESTAYGTEPEHLEIATDELGDALFSLLSVANALDIDASEALECSLEKYRERLEATGSPGSGA